MNSSIVSPRYKAKDLILFATDILVAAGLSFDKAKIVADTLVEADLMGHSTHGLQLLPAYLKELENGGMTSSGEPEVVNDLGSSITWNGNYLPGPWLVHKAIDVALERILSNPVITMVIQKSHHIACLAAYLQKVTEKGYLILLSCSDPRNKTVAPFGGTSGVYSPNPLAAGIPTLTEPVLLDVSMSATANASIKRAYDQEKKLPHPWLLCNDGTTTDDPATFFQEPPSTILPLGNQDTGYKGFALGILVEALTSALGGYGRSDNPSKWTASVFIQLIDPQAFGGSAAFNIETQHLVDLCKSSSEGTNNNVRMPGHNAIRLKREQTKDGLCLSSGILNQLQDLSIQYRIAIPSVI